MFIRLKRTATSFVVMVGMFWVYRLIAEPLIEPPVVEKRVQPVSPEERAAAQRQRQNRLGVYARFFPDGAWERDNPIVLESDNSKLLLKEYTNTPDGRVELHPCTVIYLPDGESDGADHRRVIIMQAPQGAVLRFDEAVDLSRGKMGRLLGGVLNGPVTIQSGPTKPEGGDDLLITTHDVVMDDNVISTPNPVDFRFGASVGHGRELKIVLTPSTEPSGKRRGPNIGGVQTIQLLHDVEMHLQTGAAGFLPGDQPQSYSLQTTGANGKAAGANRNNPPVDVRCQGPFEFDPVQYVATFHDNVTALRPNRWGSGPNDSLNCERLSVYFLPRDEKKTAGSGNDKGKSKGNSTNAGMPRLEPRKFSAEGNPVILRAPSNSLEAQARSISYQPDAADHWLGEMDSLGPGWLTMVSPRDPDSRFEATWSRAMKMRPQEENHVLSVLGDALVRSTRQNETQAIRADGIHLWLFEIPPEDRPANGGRGSGGNASSDAAARIRPIRMMAEGNVKINSPELSGSVNRLQTVFSDPLAAQASNGTASGSQQVGNRFSMPLQNRAAHSQNPAAPRTHYEIKQGDLLETWMLYQPRTAVEQATARLQEAKIKGHVWFAESPSAQSEEQPLDIHGEELHLEHADTNPQVAVFGRLDSPATVVARGMTLSGQNVQVDRGQNRLWIDGIGRMTIEGRPAANDGQAPPEQTDDLFSARGTLVIDWQGAMNFDGRTARFDREVVAQQIERTQTQTLRTPRLEATLAQPIDFSAPRMNERGGERPQMGLLFCRGPVWLERRETKDGNLAAIDRLDRICDLSVNRMTGEVNGTVPGPEPGRMLSWSIGSPMQLTARTGTRTVPAAHPAAAAEKQINFSQVQFQQGLTGNVLPDRRELTFRDQVRAIFGPVPTFDAQLDVDVAELAPGNVSMNCDQLTVNREVNTNDRTGGELTALGNTRIEGRQPEGDMFTALAPRVSYSRSKRMIVLTGKDRNFAQLHSQDQPGGSMRDMTAGEIQYWPDTRSAKITKPRIDAGFPAANQPAARSGSKSLLPSAALQPSSTRP